VPSADVRNASGNAENKVQLERGTTEAAGTLSFDNLSQNAISSNAPSANDGRRRASIDPPWSTRRRGAAELDDRFETE
jgi:hypothetical protein